jgi:hypothetical protein
MNHPSGSDLRQELADLSPNPLLIDMTVMFHWRYPSAKLPKQQVELYQEICLLQLRDRHSQGSRLVSRRGGCLLLANSQVLLKKPITLHPPLINLRPCPGIDRHPQTPQRRPRRQPRSPPHCPGRRTHPRQPLPQNRHTPSPTRKHLWRRQLPYQTPGIHQKQRQCPPPHWTDRLPRHPNHHSLPDRSWSSHPRREVGLEIFCRYTESEKAR